MACCSLARSQQTEISTKGLEIAPAPVKLDKNLRQALLKALTDLEAESEEQRKDEDVKSLVEMSFDDVTKKDVNTIQKTTFSFDGFPGDEETPNEEKLQNSSFVDLKKYASLSSSSAMTIEKASRDDARSFHVHNVPSAKPTAYTPRAEPKMDLAGPRGAKTSSASSSSVNKVVESVTFKPITQVSESLTQSASSGIANANSLIMPKPTASTVPPKNVTSDREKPLAEEVKIFQAPLVAAFTVQQDELGVPKSVVPIYRQTGDGQALTIQEQLEFKQKLLEQQLAELQQQQIQQTQFLLRQRQLYEQQLIQKQQQQQLIQKQRQQQLYLQEQARIKQLEEQAKIKQLEEQRLYRLHQHNLLPVQKPNIFEQTNTLALHPPAAEPSVHLQPSVALEVPSAVAPPLFRTTSYQEQLHFQQLRGQPPPQPQHLQRLQQSFGTFSNDFQPPVAPASRYNRQEAFNAVGNFGFNQEKQPPPSRNTFTFNAPTRYPSTFVYNPYVQFRQVTPARPQTPAKQIQRLLYQSGVAGELGNVPGSGGHEDLNIVSKVLALNVGALPNNNYQQFSASNRGKLA